MPALMGLLNVWYVNPGFKACSHAVLPHAQYLHRFAAYLQQLTMESNGKGVRMDGSPVTTETGEIFWGEPGTNGQHAFYQLLHQGTRLIPCDFIAVATPGPPDQDGGQDVHELFLANFFAQTKALASARPPTRCAPRGSGGARHRQGLHRQPADDLDHGARPDAGCRGSTHRALRAHHLRPGRRVGIDSFDQWGVELGKQLALQIARRSVAIRAPSTRRTVQPAHSSSGTAPTAGDAGMPRGWAPRHTSPMPKSTKFVACVPENRCAGLIRRTWWTFLSDVVRSGSVGRGVTRLVDQDRVRARHRDLESDAPPEVLRP